MDGPDGSSARAVLNPKHSREKLKAPLEGRVVAAFGRQFHVEFEDGTVAACVTRGKKGGVACGDRVEIDMTGIGQGVIRTILPRTSLLYRSDAFREKIIAANVDQVIIVVAAVPSYYEDLINRCLVAVEANGINPLIVLNKCDLAEESQRALADLQLYRDLGYDVLALSATHDVSPLLPFLKGHTSVLVGQSGMGKSSIINGMLPEAAIVTAEISEALDSGRHTTTNARLYHLDATSHIIDSPGMQEFGLHHFKPEQIDHAFIEFRPYLGRCKFSNCRHLGEPECAVEQAVAVGAISVRRLKAYRGMVGAGRK
jgi:ribosome biogenesis GTPase / thiamine phosphate phosphatase